MDQKEKFVAILGGGLLGLVALVFAGSFILKSGYRPELTPDQLLYGFFHAVFLLLMAIFGWFSALRVGPAIPTPLKVAVLGTTAVLYYWATKLWIPLIMNFVQIVGDGAGGTGGAGMSTGTEVALMLLACIAALVFVRMTVGAVRSR